MTSWRSFHPTLLVLATAAAAAVFPLRSATAMEPDVKLLVGGNSTFAFDLYGALRSDPGNVFFSPYSISTALAMTYGGARGETEAEMARTLHLPFEGGRVHAAFAHLQAALDEEAEKGNYEWNVANRLWGQRDYDFLPAYLELTERYYGAPLETLDFMGSPEPARQTINRWVEEQTRDRIQDLLPSGSITRDTVLVLTNAIYFLGNWERQFPAEATREAPFFLAGNETVDVSMMHQQGRFRHAAVDGVQLLEMPYQGRRLAMVVVLPESRGGLGAVEDRLSPAALDGWLGRLAPREVSIFFPRFRVESQFNLNETLEELGMPTAFSQDADFSAMSSRRDLAISDVVHKAFVEVDEKGTEAAAATGVVIGRLALPPQPV